MPLSEHEQHLLEQMEQAMYAEDPRFASSMQGSLSRARLRRRVAIGSLAFLVGLALIVLGVVNMRVAALLVLFGAVGFALMVAGVAYAVTPAKTPQAVKAPLAAVADDGTVRRAAGTVRGAKTGGKTKTGRGRRKQSGPAGKRGGSFMDRIEQRWDKRRGNWQ